MLKFAACNRAREGSIISLKEIEAAFKNKISEREIKLDDSNHTLEMNDND